MASKIQTINTVDDIIADFDINGPWNLVSEKTCLRYMQLCVEGIERCARLGNEALKNKKYADYDYSRTLIEAYTSLMSSAEELYAMRHNIIASNFRNN